VEGGKSDKTSTQQARRAKSIGAEVEKKGEGPFAPSQKTEELSPGERKKWAGDGGPGSQYYENVEDEHIKTCTGEEKKVQSVPPDRHQ